MPQDSTSLNVVQIRESDTAASLGHEMSVRGYACRTLVERIITRSSQ